MSQVEERIARLAARQGSFEIFGASKHRYRTHVVSEAALQQLEQQLGTALPGPYRTFLNTIGYGAGPYYGLFGPGEILAELNPLSEQHVAV